MLNGVGRVGVAIGALAAMTVAQSQTVTYDFTGTGVVCQYTYDEHECTEDVAFTGEITLEVNTSVGPSHSDGSTYARRTSFWKDAPHWVTSQVVVYWQGSSYATEVIPTGSGTDTTYRAEVLDNFPTYAEEGAFLGYQDRLYAYTKAERMIDSRLYYWNTAHFDRHTFDDTWLQGLAFDTNTTLPPEGEATLEFDTQSEESNGGEWSMSGVTGHITLQTLTRRDSETPPSLTLSSNVRSVADTGGSGGGGSLGGLMALALSGALFLRRRRLRC